MKYENGIRYFNARMTKRLSTTLKRQRGCSPVNQLHLVSKNTYEKLPVYLHSNRQVTISNLSASFSEKGLTTD